MFGARKLAHNGLHMACGGFEALPGPPKPRLVTERKPCCHPSARHKLYVVCALHEHADHTRRRLYKKFKNTNKL